MVTERRSDVFEARRADDRPRADHQGLGTRGAFEARRADNRTPTEHQGLGTRDAFERLDQVGEAGRVPRPGVSERTPASLGRDLGVALLCAAIAACSSGGSTAGRVPDAGGSGDAAAGDAGTSPGADGSTPTDASTGPGDAAAGDAAGSGLAILNAPQLPSGTAGQAYQLMLTAQGGQAPYSWQVSAGALPAGLTLSTAGLLTGTPQLAGTTSFTLTVTDAARGTASGNFTLTIAASQGGGLSVAPFTGPNAVVGAPYSAVLLAQGGTPPYRWAVASGALPPGLTLTSSGAISGTPTAAGFFTVVVRVQDGSAPSMSASASVGIPVLAMSGGLSVTTASLPGGTVGSSYQAALEAAGGTPPYAWSIASGALPDGVSLSSSGQLAGAPSAPGTFSFVVQVTDSAATPQVGARSLAITVQAAPLRFATAALPGGVVGFTYSASVAVSGGVAPYTFSVSSGALPAGLSLDPTTGSISGTPSATGTTAFTLQVADSATPQATATQPLAIIVGSPTRPPVVTTARLPDAVAGASYAAQLDAAGGAPPYTWSIAAGALPSGVTLRPSGALEGVPAAAGVSTFTVRVQDTAHPARSATAALSLATYAPLAVGPAVLPGGTTGAAYSAPLSVRGGQAPYTLALSGGSLPPGISLSATGVLSGTPSSAGVFGFSLRVTDAASPAQSTNAEFSLAITIPLAIATASLPDGTAGAPYDTTVVAQGGTPPYAWAVSGGALPAGLTLDATSGRLSGTPAQAGAFDVTLAVNDAASGHATARFAIAIAPEPLMPTITTAGLPGAVVGQAYDQSLSAISGAPPYTWSVPSGTLPAGLSLDPATGVLSGTPLSAGTSSITVRVTDTVQGTGSRTFVLLVVEPLVATASLPRGVTTELYVGSLGVSGGKPPYRWAIASGALPPGLALDAASGAITGTPGAAGTFAFTAQVADTSSPGLTASESLAIQIDAHVAITTTALPSATLGAAYSTELAATGGTAPFTWSLVQGPLPPGLGLTPGTGAISGTPTSTGRYAFTVQVTDASSPAQTAQVQLSLPVNGAGALTITTTMLAPGLTGSAYSAALAASGGTAPYAWSLVGGSLPAGLSLDTTSGAISGTPATAGDSTFTVQVSDQSVPGQVATQRLSITIIAPLALATTALPDGVTGTAYAAPLAATGGRSPYTWSIASGALPPGLTLDQPTGLISGTPNTTGMFSFTVQVADASAPAMAVSRAFQVAIGSPLAIRTANLPGSTVGDAYSAQLRATGGITPYAWSVHSGALPGGLTLNANGTLSGVPTTAGTFSFTLAVIDSARPAQLATRTYSVVINAALSVATAVLPGGSQGVAYSARLLASGGQGGDRWTISSGALPPGLRLGLGGLISGTPTMSGTYSFTVQATDSGNPQQVATRALMIVIAPPGALAITTSNLPVASAGASYAAALSAIGGTMPYTWSVSAGALPPGLTLDPHGGLISGTASMTGTFNFTVEVTDSAGTPEVATQPLSIAVNPALAVATTGLPGGVTMTTYSAPLSAIGGTSPYRWTITSGALPPGLRLNAMTGLISGTPTVEGTFGFVVRVADSAGAAASQALSIVIGLPLSIATASPLPAASAGSAYQAALTASGGSLPYTWSLTGSAPPGLALDAATGVISGTPTAAGSYVIGVRVMDHGTPAQQASATFTLQVH